MSDDARPTDPIPEDAHSDPNFEQMVEAIFAEQRDAGNLAGPPPGARPVHVDESASLFIGKELTLDEFQKWWKVQGLGTEPFNAVGYHHTENPTQNSWAGMPTLNGIFNFYHKEKGWPKGLGPQLFVYSGDGPYSPGEPRIYVATHPAHDGVGIFGHNRRWLHIEHVWNGDVTPFSTTMKQVSGKVLSIVCAPSAAANRQVPIKFIKGPGIDNPSSPLGIMYHRDENPVWPKDGGWPKSCPGLKVSHENLDADVIAFAAGGGVIASTDFAVGQLLTVETETLNLRSAPGLAFAILAELAQGTEVTVMEGPFELEDHQWYRVSGPPEGPGWLAGDFLKVAV